MDGAGRRLAAEPAVRAFVAEALLRSGGDAARAAELMRLRLVQGRPEDAGVRRRVRAEVAATLRKRLTADRRRRSR